MDRRKTRRQNAFVILIFIQSPDKQVKERMESDIKITKPYSKTAQVFITFHQIVNPAQHFTLYSARCNYVLCSLFEPLNVTMQEQANNEYRVFFVIQF